MSEKTSFPNAMHKGVFRFDVTSSPWRMLYKLSKDENASNVITVTKNGMLHGYAVYFTFVRGQFRQFSVLDIYADCEGTLAELVDRLKERAQEEDADLIYLRKAADLLDRVFDQQGFLSFVESIIVVALLNPNELLHALSQEVDIGKNLRLNIKGFDPITVRVGKNGIEVIASGKPDLTMSTNSGTFLKLLFCRTSFWKEFLKRTIKISRISMLPTATRFLNIIKQERWHIPLGDWT